MTAQQPECLHCKEPHIECCDCDRKPTRPHPPAPEQASPCFNCKYNYYPCSKSETDICLDKLEWLEKQKEHDDAVARTATLAAYDKAIAYLKTRLVWDIPYAVKQGIEDSIKDLESLRQQAGEQQ